MHQPDFATSPLFERERKSRQFLRMRKFGGRLHNSAESLHRGQQAAPPVLLPTADVIVADVCEINIAMNVCTRGMR